MISLQIFLALIVVVNSFDLEEPEIDEGMTPICRISRCFCDQATKTVLCRHVIFPNLPKFPTWTETLKLANNHLTLLKNASFEGLHRVQRLYLSSSDLEIIEPAAFSGMNELTILDLSNNRIRTFPSATFRYLPRLSILNISGNTFSDLSIFDSFPSDVRLTEFVMRNAEFACCPGNSRVNFPESERFFLSGTKFYSFTRNGLVLVLDEKADAEKLGGKNVTIGIDSLAHADELDLNNCQARLTPSFFDAVRFVKILNIGGNKIEGNASEILWKLNDFPRLEMLNVSGLSRIRSKQSIVANWNIFPVSMKNLDVSFLGIRNMSFEKLSGELISLKSSNNFLYTLHLANSMKKLERLELNSNQLISFPTADHDVQFFQLEILDLSDNLITHVDEHSLWAYPNLKILRLSKNRIATIDSKAFSSTCCSALEFLDISHNSLEHLPRIRLPSLKILNLSNNRFVSIEKSGVFSSAKRLEILDISDNHDLMSFLGKAMVNCTDEENCLASTWVGELASLSILRQFYASRVGFSHFPMAPFNIILSRVRDLDLNDNAITSEDWENAVSFLPSKPCLRSLHLADNKLTRLKNLTIFKNDCLEILDLTSNPFICDCHIESVVTILKSLSSEEVPFYNDTRYYCFSAVAGSYRRILLHELGASTGLKLACVQENRSRKVAAEATAIGFYAILGVLLGSATFVIMAICCKACLMAANQYVRSIRQRMYEPLRVIITSDLASPAGTPAML